MQEVFIKLFIFSTFGLVTKMVGIWSHVLNLHTLILSIKLLNSTDTTILKHLAMCVTKTKIHGPGGILAYKKHITYTEKPCVVFGVFVFGASPCRICSKSQQCQSNIC